MVGVSSAGCEGFFEDFIAPGVVEYAELAEATVDPGLLISIEGGVDENQTVEAVMSAGLDGRYLGTSAAACARASEDFAISCEELEGLRALGRQKLTVLNQSLAMFSTRFGEDLDQETKPICYREDEFDATGLHVDALHGWYTGSIYGISPELEPEPYRFIESVDNDEMCPVLLCDPWRIESRRCHPVLHQMGVPQTDGTLAIVGSLPRLGRLDDTSRPVLPDLVPILPDVRDGRSTGGMVTECARSARDSVANNGAPHIQGVRLRFASAFANLGHGPLHLRPEGGAPPDHAANTWAIEQVIYDALDLERTWTVESDGEMLHHPSHNHFHLTQLYQTSVSDPDRPELGLQHIRKLGFCIEATDMAASYDADNYPSMATFRNLYGRRFEDLRMTRVLDDGRVIRHKLGVSSCQVAGQIDVYEQGLHPGWVDEYDAGLAGQSIDLLQFPEAVSLRFDVLLDPLNQISELNERNNAASFEVGLEDLAIPWESLDYDADGSVILLGHNTQSALDEWCSMREDGGGSEAFEHWVNTCDPPSSFGENDDSGRNSCFDYAACQVLGALTCVQDQTQRWFLAECIDAEGALRRQRLGGCASGLEFTCDASGRVVRCA